MTTKAIQLAKECGLPAADIEALQEHQPEFLETFYHRAQAQALREAANLGFSEELRRMADELERKA